MLDIRKLLMLRAIDSEGSIAAAARSLKYTRSAVSQQISALERETRARLVERTAGQQLEPSDGDWFDRACSGGGDALPFGQRDLHAST